MVWWMIAAWSAFFVKGLCGFANTLVFTTILSFGNSNVSITPVELVLGYPANAFFVWKERRSISWKICLPLAALVMIGSIPGILFLKHADTGMIKRIFGIVILLLGAEMLVREWKPKQCKQSKVVLGIIGILSGILCGLYGIGALLGAYVSRITENSSAFKANLCVVFLIENTFRLVVYSIWGILTAATWKQAGLLLPFMGIGLGLGVWSSSFLQERIIKRLVLVMLMVSGAALLITG